MVKEKTKDLLKELGVKSKEEMLAEKAKAIENGEIKPVSSDETVTSEIIKTAAEQFDATQETKKYLDSLSAGIETQISGAVDKITKMIEGKIPASFRDLASAYSTIKNSIAQLNSVLKATKEAIISDPLSPDAFYVGNTMYEYQTKKVNTLNKKAWAKSDPVGYASVMALYSAKVERNYFKTYSRKNNPSFGDE